MRPEFFGFRIRNSLDFGSSVRIQLWDCSKSAIRRKSDNDVTYDLIITIFFIKFSSWFKFHINIITGDKLSIWQLLFVRDWIEVPNSKVSSSKFWPIVHISLIKSYWILQNARVIFCSSESKVNTFVSSVFRFPPPGAKKPKNSFFRVFIIQY